MKFGYVDANKLPQIDFGLPPDVPATQALLNALAHPTQPPSFYVGCSVWTDRSFVGKLYPQGAFAKDFLKLYCQQFNTVELNATFYSIPSVEKVKQWKTAASPGFKFCPKVSQTISHRKNIDKQLHFLDNFIEAVLHFEEALGTSFLQLPPYFEASSMKALQQVIQHVPREVPLAIEFRHPSWFSNAKLWQEMCACLQAYGTTAVITDVAGRRDVLHQTLTTNCAFIRFKGNNLDNMDYRRLDAWAEKLCQWTNQGLVQVYFLLHELEKALCVDLAVYFIQRLNELAGLQLKPPKLETQQTSLF